MDKLTEKQKKLLDIAIEMFHNIGFKEVSMRDLAKEIGIKASSIYAHFNSKEEILKYACYDVFRRVNAIPDTVDVIEDPRERFHHFIKVYLETILFNIPQFNLYVKYGKILNTENKPFFQEKYLDSIDYVDGLLDGLEGRRELIGFKDKATARMILMILNNVPFFVDKDNYNIDRVGEEIQQIVCKGFAKN